MVTGLDEWTVKHTKAFSVTINKTWVGTGRLRISF